MRTFARESRVDLHSFFGRRELAPCEDKKRSGSVDKTIGAATLKKPEPGTPNETNIFIQHAADRLEEEEAIVEISAYRTSKVDRYLKG